MKSGFYLINKDSGITTNSINNYLKHKYKLNKVGHLGTLDPFACGLLLIGINEATKFFPLITNEDKRYIAKLKLGYYSDTYDITGKIIKNDKIVKKYKIDEIKKVLNSFLGKSYQIPPIYSAKKVDGKRAYDLARKNISVNLKEQEIEIKEINLLNYDLNDDIIEFDVLVSKGTYIRSLGLDIARKLNTSGYLISLCRTNIGSLDIKDSIKEKEIDVNNIIPLTNFFNYPIYNLNENEFIKANNGNNLNIKNDNKYVFLVYKEKLIALYEKNDNIFRCYRRLNNYENI